MTVRRARLDRWDEEISIGCGLFNASVSHVTDYVPISETQLRHTALDLGTLSDKDSVHIAEVDGEATTFALASPDINRMLVHGNGGHYLWDWLKICWCNKRIEVASFKIVAMLPEDHGRGLEAILYLTMARAAIASCSPSRPTQPR